MILYHYHKQNNVNIKLTNEVELLRDTNMKIIKENKMVNSNNAILNESYHKIIFEHTNLHSQYKDAIDNYVKLLNSQYTNRTSNQYTNVLEE